MTKVGEIFQTPAGTLVIRGRSGLILPLTQAATTTKQADGSWRFEPLDDWISVKEAAKLMKVHATSVFRMGEIYEGSKPLIDFRRPTPSRVHVRLASVLEHLQKTTEDPEFWDRCKAR